MRRTPTLILRNRSTCPLRCAVSAAAFPRSSFRKISAPAVNKASTASMCPLLDARIRAVLPCLYKAHKVFQVCKKISAKPFVGSHPSLHRSIFWLYSHARVGKPASVMSYPHSTRQNEINSTHFAIENVHWPYKHRHHASKGTQRRRLALPVQLA